jgi:prevent-host-death family protein
MIQFSVTNLKANFLSVLALVETGETIIITRHGKPIIEICPASEEGSMGDPVNLERRSEGQPETTKEPASLTPMTR